MKKRINILLIMLLLTTGCTCEYNLRIDNDTYKEEVILKADNSEELSNFNNKWQISIDKNESNIGTDPSATEEPTSNGMYKYNLTGNNLVFTYTFPINQYTYSTAVSKCYNNLTTTNYNNSIIISTSSNAICFDNYPNLNNVIVNITVDRNVISNNADSVSGKTYTWNLNKSNANNKSIDLILDNSNEESKTTDNNNPNKNNTDNKRDYTMYIFSGMLLLSFLLGYLIFNKIKKEENNMDV